MLQQTRSRAPRGSLSPAVVLLILSVIAFIALGWSALMLRPSARIDRKNVVVQLYCAAGVANPIEEAAKEYEKLYGVRVELSRTGGSGTLYGQIEAEAAIGLQSGADLFISADDQLLELGRQAGIIAERIPLARQYPIIAVSAESDLQLSSLADLVGASPNLRFAITNDGAAIGKVTRQIAAREGVLDSLLEKAKTEAENVMTLAQALQTGSVDAVVIWNTTVAQVNQQNEKPVLRIAASLGDESDASHIALGVISETDNPTEVLRLARYLAARDKGLQFLQRAGFDVVQGDRWEEVPEIHLYCGSMFTAVFEEAVRRFAEREGVSIYPRWEGCGKLVATMRSIEDASLFPDAYLACDQQFLDRVADLFETPQVISSNDLVLAVRREMSENVRSPRDLRREGVRVGICHPDESALGQLTKHLLSRPPFAGLYDEIAGHAVVVADVGPTLISQLLAGGLDAAIVYRSNVISDQASLQVLEIVSIDDRESGAAQATQPWAVARSSPHKQLMQRLFQVLISRDSQSRFDAAGFRWRYRQ